MTTPLVCPEPAQLRLLLDESLTADERAALEKHLDACAGCRQALERLAGEPASWPEIVRDFRGESDTGDEPSNTQVVPPEPASAIRGATTTGVMDTPAGPGA